MQGLNRLAKMDAGSGWKTVLGGAALFFALLIAVAILVPVDSVESDVLGARSAVQDANYELAVATYERALSQWDAAGDFPFTQAEIAAERDQARQAWAATVVVEGQAFLAGDDLTAAEARLAQALDIWSDSDAAAALAAAIAQHQAGADLDILLATIATNLAAGELDAAQANLAAAEDLVGEAELPELRQLRAEVETRAAEAQVAATQGELTAYFFDVGQGDATLLKGPDFAILIDAGRHNASDVVPYLRSAGVSSLDLLIGTHPHADHIGQFDRVLSALPVGEVWMSGDAHTTQTFERTLDAMLASDASYHEPRAGEVFTFGSAVLEVVNPDRLTGDLHEGSLSVRVRYGQIAFMFTGDAEHQTEQAMVGRGHDLRAQILQVGHHGSRTSSTRPFLEAVNPDVAIYSAGANNPYGHPHGEVLDRLADMNIAIYGTEVNGTVRVVTDGSGYEVQVERPGDPRAPPEEEATSDPAPEDPGQDDLVVTNGDGCRPGQIDINTASYEALQEIHQIGPDRATQIMELRPFSSIDDMARISGIGPIFLEEIKEQGLACTE